MKTVLIVGCGISGLSCAIRCGKLGFKTVLVSSAPSERSQSVMAAGGINAVGEEPDSIESHIADTLKGGCFLEDEGSVQGLCTAAPDVVDWLEQIGVVFSRDTKGKVDRRAFGGQTHPRTAYSGACTGKQIVTALVRQARSYEFKGNLTRHSGMTFYSALIKDGTCYGALFLNMRDNTLVPVYADAVVIATGGQNRIFGKTTGSRLCDGYVAGKLFEQGVRMRNLEFIQYHPTTIETAHKRMLISEAARGEGGRLYYLDGEKRVYFMEERFGPKGNLMPRDVVSRCIHEAPSQVYLDISFLGEKKIKERLFEIYELCRRYIGLDVTKESIPVAPSVHFFMGGIDVDCGHRTNTERLYAVGECASIYHGANRLGGNSLLAAVYSGITAADRIGALPEAGAEDFADYIEECKNELKESLASKSKFPAVYIQNLLSEAMNQSMGIVRWEEGLKNGLSSVDYALSVCGKLHFDPEVSVYDGYSLRSMLLLSKACILSALSREESRGAHYRSDFPECREEFRRPTVAEMKDGEIIISFREV